MNYQNSLLPQNLSVLPYFDCYI